METGEKGEKENDHTEMIWSKIDFSISGKKEWMRLESDDYYRISSGCRVFRYIQLHQIQKTELKLFPEKKIFVPEKKSR